MKAVEVKELVKDYGNFRALKGISFEVNEGEIFGLIDPNDSGSVRTFNSGRLLTGSVGKRAGLGGLVWGFRR